MAELLFAQIVSMFSSYISAAKVRHAVAGLARGRIAEYARSVTVERSRLAVTFDVRTRRLEVAKRRFGGRKSMCISRLVASSTYTSSVH